MGNSVHDVKINFTAGQLQAGEPNAVSLFDRRGNRKYLTAVERRAFLNATGDMPADVRAFLVTLAFTGARISEVLSLSPAHIDVGAGMIVIETLKKRRRGVFRAVPVPPALLNELGNLYAGRRVLPSWQNSRLWPWCRTTAWRHVKVCMSRAGVVGPQASPKALRHGFAVGALDAKVPLPLVQKWLGHSRLSTTAIYANAVGDEERAMASRYWDAF
jgi:integrase/recombinase XerD